MNKLDTILYEALEEKDVPSKMLNRQILEKADMEEKKMNKNKKNMAAAAAVTLFVAFAGSATAYAAYRYMNSSEVANAVSNNDNLARAFESKDAISINEVQKSGDYVFNLMGIVTGSNLAPYVSDDSKNKIDDRKTYITMAISKNDGDDMPDRNFCVSPLIGGVPIDVANNGTLDTQLIWFEQDGVIYELVECDNLEMFADRGVWISAVDSFGDEEHAYLMDEAGCYMKNSAYEGFSALFKIPFDTSKADRAAADKYLKKIEDENSLDTEQNIDDNTAISEFMKSLENISQDEIDERFDEVEGHTVTAEPDADGNIDMTYVEDDVTCGVSGNINYIMPDDKDFVVADVLSGDNGPDGFIAIYRNDDGSFTCKEYKLK